MVKGKRGGEKFLSIWWFFVLGVIVGGIVIVVSAFNVSDFDTKRVESEILVIRFIDCVVEKGEINPAFLEDDFEVLKECNFDKNVMNKMYLNYTYYLEGGKKSEYFGKREIQKQCRLKEKSEAKHYPSCFEKSVYFSEGRLNVIAGSNQVIKNEG